MKKAKVQKLGPNQRKWLKALESGKYQQDRGGLHFSGGGFCCLGVACEIFAPKNTKIIEGEKNTPVKYAGLTASAPFYIRKALRLRGPYGSAADPIEAPDLATLNDTGKKLREIAEIIRKDPAQYFKAPA